MNRLFCLLVLSFSCITAQAVTADERLALKDWSQLMDPAEPMLISPYRRPTTRVQRIQRYIKEVFEKVSDGELKDQPIFINLYATHRPYVWIIEHSGQSGSEAKWLNKHGSRWPVRSYLGLQDESPLIEIALSTGLWNSLEYEDELALLLKRELIRYEWGQSAPYDSTLRGSKRRREQKLTSILDRKAMKALAGRYEIEVMPYFLKKHLERHSLSPERDRLRFAKAEDYYKLLRDLGVRAKAIKPLLELGTINRAMRNDPDEPGHERWYENLEKTVREQLLQGHVPDLFLQRIIEGISILDAESPTFEQYTKTLHRMWDVIAQANASKANKVNTFLLIERYLQKVLNHSSLYDGMRPDELIRTLVPQKLERFLAENSIGPDAWTYADFKPYADRLKAVAPHWADSFLGLNPFANIYARLSQVFPEWDRFLADCASLPILSDEEGLENLVFKLTFVMSSPDAYFRTYSAKLLEHLSRLPADEVKIPLDHPTYKALLREFGPEANDKADPDTLKYIEGVRRCQALFPQESI